MSHTQRCDCPAGVICRWKFELPDHGATWEHTKTFFWNDRLDRSFIDLSETRTVAFWADGSADVVEPPSGKGHYSTVCHLGVVSRDTPIERLKELVEEALTHTRNENI